jgi:hypothetical protein
LPPHSNWLWGSLSLIYEEYWEFIPGVKQPKSEVNYSPPSGAVIDFFFTIGSDRAILK